MNYLKTILLLVLAGSMASCELELEPYDGKSDETIFNSIEGLKAATLGNYNYIKDPYYTRNFFMLGEYPGDNVSLSGTTLDHLFYAYNYQHITTMSNTANIWRKAYQAIYGTNRIIETIENGESEELDQLKGENLFLRAMCHFDLVRLFGRPYPQNNGDNPGIMIRDNTDITQLPPRSSVKEVYEFVINDLLQAAELMNEAKNSSFASKEVAYALLARVYLYMEENEKAIEYADKVIGSGRYQLVDTETFKKYFTIANESNPETIFAIKHTKNDDRTWSSLGSMYYNGEGIGYGEMYASKPYRELLDKYPEDARHSFIEPQYELDADGNIKHDSEGDPILKTRNGYPKYYVNKFSYQEGLITLSSPVVLRLAEMYLTRAEANAKLGNDEQALEDVNLIRQRAGLLGEALYSASDLKGHDSVLDVVLEERRLELAFEAHRPFDVFRNNRVMNRSYPGTHLISGQTKQIIQPDDPRVVYYIPEQELIQNPNLTQNP